MSGSKALIDIASRYSDPDEALAMMVSMRWPKGVACPECGRMDLRFIAPRRLWECKTKHARRQFTAKRGTVFEDSALGLDIWFATVWMIANDTPPNSFDLQRELGVTQKTGWLMLHRIQLAMETETFRNKLIETRAPSETQRFRALMQRLLCVSRSEIDEKERQWKATGPHTRTSRLPRRVSG
jgi:hypothetical protein